MAFAGPVDQRRRTGYAMVITSAVLFAINGTVSKVMLVGGLAAPQLTQLRSGGAFVALLVFVGLRNPTSLRFTRHEAWWIALYGIVGFAMTQYLYFVAIKRLPVGIALLIEFTAPIMVALWARFVLKELVRRRVWGALALALVGLALVAQVWGGLSLDGLGVVAAMGAALALALYFILGEHLVGPRDPVSLACLAFGFGSVFWAVVSPWWNFPFAILGRQISLLGNISSWTAPMWMPAIYLVIGGTLLPFTLSIGALRHLRAAQVGVVGMVEPVVAALVAYLWLDEALGWVQLVGGAVVLTGVVLAETARAAGAPAGGVTDIGSVA